MQNFAPAASLPTSCELRLALRYVPICKLYHSKETDQGSTSNFDSSVISKRKMSRLQLSNMFSTKTGVAGHRTKKNIKIKERNKNIKILEFQNEVA